MCGDQVGLCRRGRNGKRLSKQPSNSKGSEPVCPAVTADGHTGSPQAWETQTQSSLGISPSSRGAD